MRNIMTIFGKEMRLIFSGPVAYVVLASFLLLTGFFFFDLFANYSQILSYASMYQNPAMLEQVNVNQMILTPLMHNISILLMLIVPILTARLYAEEKSAGTDELLLTSPIRVSEIISGKLLAGLAFYLLLLMLTIHFPAVLFKYANPDLGTALSGYLGLFLMGAAFISFGLFVSTLTDSQVVAAISSFALLLIFWILGWLAESQSGLVGEVLGYLSMTQHFEHFGEGLISVVDLVYYLSFIALFWFLATRAVESTRWR